MKTLVKSKSSGYRLVDDIDIPVLKLNMMLYRVHAVALSLYNAKIIDYSNTPNIIDGYDFARIIIKVNESVTRFKKSDRVFTITFNFNALNKTAGAFAEYVLIIKDLNCHILNNLSFA